MKFSLLIVIALILSICFASRCPPNMVYNGSFCQRIPPTHRLSSRFVEKFLDDAQEFGLSNQVEEFVNRFEEKFAESLEKSLDKYLENNSN